MWSSLGWEGLCSPCLLPAVLSDRDQSEHVDAFGYRRLRHGGTNIGSYVGRKDGREYREGQQGQANRGQGPGRLRPAEAVLTPGAGATPSADCPEKLASLPGGASPAGAYPLLQTLTTCREARSVQPPSGLPRPQSRGQGPGSLQCSS